MQLGTRFDGGFLDHFPVLVFVGAGLGIEYLDDEVDRTIGDAGDDRDETGPAFEELASGGDFEGVGIDCAEGELGVIGEDCSSLLGHHPAFT
ncbi:hypothetical protein [Nocardia sp. NPDC050435]|uniref:hypothetical protein n=1 Tax=Nocardia sp. NPDC050435 TaxID=3155040 RepID=UPI0033FF8246